MNVCFQIIAPQFKHFQKLRDFVEIKLPPGFPVKVDIPVLPTVSARVTFHDFAWKNTKTNPLSAAMQNGGGGGTNGNKGENGWQSEDDDGGEDSGRKERRSLKGLDGEEDEVASTEASALEDDELTDDLFDIPKDYVEDNNRFPDL